MTSFSALIKTAEVAITDDVKITVRGLTFSDVTSLLSDYSSEMAEIFESVQTPEELSAEKLQDITYGLLSSMPSFFEECIFLASKKQVPRSDIADFGAGITIELIERVLELTIDSFGGPKKFAETVRRIMSKILPIRN